MRRAVVAFAAFASLSAGTLAAVPALAEVRGFEPIHRAPTPGEAVASPSFGMPEMPLMEGPGLGLMADPRDQRGAEPQGADAASKGGVRFSVGGAALADNGYYAPRSSRSRALLGTQEASEGFDRSNSIYAYNGYGYYTNPFAAYSPGWRDYSFARRVTPSTTTDLPSVSAPNSFWGFRTR